MSERYLVEDDGFIAVDAMAACLTVALVGTVMTTAAIGMLQRQNDDLDRSVALVEIQSVARQVALFGTQSWSGDTYDGLFWYRASGAQLAAPNGLESVTVSARREPGVGTELAAMTLLIPHG
jgi:hypothetical protein